jgi:hypothetical protein
VWVCAIDPGEAYELLGGGAANIWSSEHRLGKVKWRQTAAQDTSKLQPQKNMQQGSYRIASSPWSFCSGLQRRLMVEASSRSRYLAVTGERERQKSSDWAHPGPIPLAWKTHLLMRSFRDTRTASRWPAVMAPMNTGSRVLGATEITRGKGVEVVPRVSDCVGLLFIACRGRRHESPGRWALPYR